MKYSYLVSIDIPPENETDNSRLHLKHLSDDLAETARTTISRSLRFPVFDVECRFLGSRPS